MIICDAYILKIKKRLRKSEIIDKLKEHILASDSMPNAQVLCKTSKSKESSITISKDKTMYTVRMGDKASDNTNIGGPSSSSAGVCSSTGPIIPVKVIGKGKRLAAKPPSPKSSTSKIHGESQPNSSDTDCELIIPKRNSRKRQKKPQQMKAVRKKQKQMDSDEEN